MKTALETERERFEAANRHIVATEERVEAQRRRIVRLRSAGSRCEESEKLLASLLDALGVMHRYRQQVLLHLVEVMTHQRRSMLEKRPGPEQ